MISLKCISLVSRLLFLIQIDLISPFIIVSSRITNVTIYLPVFYTFYIVCTYLDLEDNRLPGSPGTTVTSSSKSTNLYITCILS